ncbi:MAG TPA: ABC transporter permease [Solirubrobacterales bacterium]
MSAGRQGLPAPSFSPGSLTRSLRSHPMWKDDPRLVLPRAVAVLAAAVMIVAAATTEGFFSSVNYQSILTSMSVTGILAVGLTPIMLSGNYFSLALGATVVTSASAFLAALTFGVVPAILMALGLALIFGLVQGVVIGGLRADPIITTIAFSTIATGVALGITGGNAVTPGGDSSAYRSLVDTHIFGVSIEVFIFAGVALLVALLLRWTRWGREVYLLGSSQSAAKTSGLNTFWVVAGAFVLASLCAGVAGIIRGASTGQMTLGFVANYDFDAVTAVLVGGTAITGGRGSVFRTVVGVFVLAVLSDVLLLRGANLETQLFVKGLIVLVVVSLTGWVELGSRRGA